MPEKLAKFSKFLLPFVVPEDFVAIRKCHLMPSADDVLLLCVPAIRDLRAIPSGAYQLVTMRRYNLPFTRLEIQAHVDKVNELYQPAPLRLHFALALHLMYIVLCQLLRRRDHPEYTKRACCNYRSSRV